MTVSVDPGSSRPVFEQICDAVLEGIRSGAIVPGTHLPTVRQLAADLDVAANTVAKAYKRLAQEGHVRTQGRNGTIVLAHQDTLAADVADAAADLARVAKQYALSLNETIGIVRRTW